MVKYVLSVNAGSPSHEKKEINEEQTLAELHNLLSDTNNNPEDFFYKFIITEECEQATEYLHPAIYTEYTNGRLPSPTEIIDKFRDDMHMNNEWKQEDDSERQIEQKDASQTNIIDLELTKGDKIRYLSEQDFNEFQLMVADIQE